MLAIAIRDTTYLLDFFEHHFPADTPHRSYRGIEEFVINQLSDYSGKQLEKIMGVTMPGEVAARCPNLCSRLWRELDIIPIALHEKERKDKVGASDDQTWEVKSIDELAESMARKCIRSVNVTRTIFDS